MQTTRYFSLRSTLGPAQSIAPLLILAGFSLLMVVGLFVDIGA